MPPAGLRGAGSGGPCAAPGLLGEHWRGDGGDGVAVDPSPPARDDAVVPEPPLFTVGDGLALVLTALHKAAVVRDVMK